METTRILKDELAALRRQVERLEAERNRAENARESFAQNLANERRRAQAAEADSWCDVCVGKGDPGTGKPCICGGSGRAQDAVSNLRAELVRHECTIAALREGLEEALSFLVTENAQLAEFRPNLKALLADPNPGAKVAAVVEAARQFDGSAHSRFDLNEAVRALDNPNK